MKKVGKIDKAMELLGQGDSTGLCLECSEPHYNIEPDAEGYQCEKCGALEVMGCEEIMIQFAF